MNKINYYTQKLARLEAKLAQFQKVGVSDRMIAIKLIWEIERIERIVKSLQSIKSEIKPFNRPTRTLTLQTPRRAYRAWVAKISPEKDPKYGGFKKQFIEPTSREFGKKGETEATFEIPVDLTAIYQDSDGDYWVFENFDGDIKIICYQEVCYRFQKHYV